MKFLSRFRNERNDSLWLSIGKSNGPQGREWFGKIQTVSIGPQARKRSRGNDHCWNFVHVQHDVGKIRCILFSFFLVTSMSDDINTTHESIAFKCNKYDRSMTYYGRVYEKDRSGPLSRIDCEKNGCQCNATKLKPNAAYFVSLDACTTSQCKNGSHAVTIHTKPEGKFRNFNFLA